MTKSRSLTRTRVIGAVCFVAVLALAAGGFLYLKHGKINFGNSQPSVTWLTDSNTGTALNITEGSSGTPTASEKTPVVIIECPTEACNSSSLDLGKVIAKYSGKVAIYAVDPYSQSDIAQALEQSFLTPGAEQMFAVQLAEETLSQQNTSITETSVENELQNTTFQQQVEQEFPDSPMGQAVYPKFYILDKSLNVLDAQVGISSASDLESFIKSGLSSATSSSSSSATSSSASSSSSSSSTTSGSASSTTSGSAAGSATSGSTSTTAPTTQTAAK